ncbi:MAG: fumarylacetoacetase [Terriglobia bacterium]
MQWPIDETHDARAESWVESANRPNADFPLQNLPLGVFRRLGRGEAPRVGVAIGNAALDVAPCVDEGLFDGIASEAARACGDASMNRLMALGPRYASALRQRLHAVLRRDSPFQKRLLPYLVPLDEVELFVPAAIGDYTDFYASIDHALNVGSLFRPQNPLLPNYKYVPVGYHGRTSSIVVSGAPVQRPLGQRRANADGPPEFGPTQRLDYELELGFFVGQGNSLGEPIRVEGAERHIFGVSLVNDWSARDIQAWEYQPLGPFLGKSFATSLSPWVVTLDALAPFRAPSAARPPDDPPPLPYLAEDASERAAIDIALDVLICSRKMRKRGLDPFRLSRGNFRAMYWSLAQMVAHHTSNGCNLRSGDLIASGTVSGPAKDAQGCLLELTRGGSEPIRLPDGEARRFLEDGDEVILRGVCERSGFRRIGLGECRGTVAAA